MSIIVNLTLATMCFTYNGEQECHPVLVGKNTPVGHFNLTQLATDQPGYGGDVLKFDESRDYIFAIHRVWLLNPRQKRLERLRGKDPKARVVSAGCVNVENHVYQKLIECCRMEKFVVER